MGDRLQHDLVMDAFKQAAQRRRPEAGLIFVIGAFSMPVQNFVNYLKIN